MGAPKGNEFWKLKSKYGRDKIFATPEILFEEACKYFQWCVENPIESEELFNTKDGIARDTKNLQRPFTIYGLCIFLNVNTKYIYDFEDGLKGRTDKLSNEFSEIITRIREIIYSQKFDGAAVGLFNTNIIARDLGLVDKKEVNDTSAKEMININIDGKGINLKK